MSRELRLALDRRNSKRGAGYAVLVVVLLGASFDIGRQPLPAFASDAVRRQPVQIAQTETPATASTSSGPFSVEQKTAIERIVKDYLVNNPELLMEIQSALEAKAEGLQAARLGGALKENANEIFRRPNTPMAGNPSGDVTIVEFSDYNCGYCKRAFSDVAKLVEQDAKIKILIKELPILSKGSEEAAKVALAARLQGKYWEAHRALMSMRGEANGQTALKAVEKLGLDMAKLRKDMDALEVKAEIEAVRNLAQKMGIQGTPYFLIGDRSVPGAPQNLLELITGHVTELRKTGCSVC
ncbi:MAG: DsbA family protein [Hyphomicrobiaceae bacterium]